MGIRVKIVERRLETNVQQGESALPKNLRRDPVNFMRKHDKVAKLSHQGEMLLFLWGQSMTKNGEGGGW